MTQVINKTIDDEIEMNDEIKALAEIVQHNCHIADARYAGDYTLCVYLLKMREMYRWEKGESFNLTLTTDDVGDWLTERESLWDDVEETEYKNLVIDDVEYDPFDNEAINILLKKKGIIYNAGLGIRCRPHFFLAHLQELIEEDQYTILIAAKEYARDMAAPPAMAQQDRIYIRQESLRRLLWEKVEEWRLSGLDNPIGRAAAYYDHENNLESALDEMSEVEMEYVIAHEKGELQAGMILNERWLELLAVLPRTHAEIMLRAVRDHLADALTTLPLLLENNNPASIHFYFGNMTAMRKKLAPALHEAYEHWHKTKEIEPLSTLLPSLVDHWQMIAKKALAIFDQQVDNASKEVAATIETMIEKRILK